MRFLYLIFSHDHQEQLARLVRAIRKLSPSCAIAIHHDPTLAPLDTSRFDRIEGLFHIPEAVRGEWGDFSLVAQYLHAMRWCDEHVEFDWLCTITGLSYPVADLSAFERRTAQREFDAYVRYFDAFDPGPWPKGMWPKGTGEDRYLYRYFKLPRLPYYYKAPDALRRMLARARVALNRSQGWVRIMPMPRRAPTRIGFRRSQRSLPDAFRICGGRQMLNLNRRALRVALDFVARHPEYTDYFRRTLIPDEAFFTSILGNAPDLRVCNDVLRGIYWPAAIGASSVGIISRAMVDGYLHGEAPFALKFDSRVDPEALDHVDRCLGSQERTPSAIRLQATR